MTLTLTTPCVVHACTQPVAQIGDVCDTCRTAFGDMLVTDGRTPMTEAEIAERDSATTRQLHAQQIVRRANA